MTNGLAGAMQALLRLLAHVINRCFVLTRGSGDCAKTPSVGATHIPGRKRADEKPESLIHWRAEAIGFPLPQRALTPRLTPIRIKTLLIAACGSKPKECEERHRGVGTIYRGAQTALKVRGGCSTPNPGSIEAFGDKESCLFVTALPLVRFSEKRKTTFLNALCSVIAFAKPV